MAAISERAKLNVKDRARAYREAHREEIREKARRFRAEHPDKVRASAHKCYFSQKEERIAKVRAIRAVDPEAFRAKARARRAKSLEKYLATESALRERIRDKLRASAMARHYAKRKTILTELKRLQNNRCAYCQQIVTGTPHIDHIMPKALGGSNEMSNLQLTCAPCNQSKCARHPIDFAQSLGRLL